MTTAMNTKRHMSEMSAQSAQTNGSCAMSSANSITMFMDAGILASIIICISIICIISISLLGLIRVALLVLVLVVLGSEYLYTPAARRKAIL